MTDSAQAWKARGAFSTPEAIAGYLAAWAVDGNPNARVLDPTCGETVFLLGAGRYLRAQSTSGAHLRGRAETKQ